MYQKDPKITTRTKPLKILTYPNEKLRKKCVPVNMQTINWEEITQLTDLMFKSMKFFKGIGLAAPQVGVSMRVITIDIDKPMVLINPVITRSDGQQTVEEGCLSIPHASGHVTRAQTIYIKYLDQCGFEQTLCAEGLLAACIQHECDHLEGILYIDKVSQLKRDMILKRMKKTGRL